ncbi:MAG: hypothetical protein ACI8PQ_001893 [Planctomycetota bacterium]|jgi:hypothetical protein
MQMLWRQVKRRSLRSVKSRQLKSLEIRRIPLSPDGHRRVQDPPDRVEVNVDAEVRKTLPQTSQWALGEPRIFLSFNFRPKLKAFQRRSMGQ